MDTHVVATILGEEQQALLPVLVLRHPSPTLFWSRRSQ